MTPEGKVKALVKAVLKEHGAYWHCPVQNGMGAPSLDFIGAFNGLFFAAETKAGNKQMTERQQVTAQSMEKAGAKVFLINEGEGLDALKEWLCQNQPSKN